MLEETIKKLKENYQHIDSLLVTAGVYLQQAEKELAELQEQFIIRYSDDPFARLKILAKKLR
ncbi:MAG: hypothetical protein GXO42_02945 [bacterium]|nr:hypothetical protein [bacterium]